MLRRTKIIATLGPATDDPDMLERIVKAGVDVVRLNFSHGTAEMHAKRLQAVRECAMRYGRYIAAIGDLQGPKIRIERFQQGYIDLKEGDRFTLDATCPLEAGNQERVGITYKQLPRDVRNGDTLLIDDGRIVLVVQTITDSQIHCEVAVGGKLSNSKGINRQGGGLSAEALTHKDRQDIASAAAMHVNYLAVSFCRTAEDIHEARRLFRDVGGSGGIIAKIERAEAIDNQEEIIRASDAVMVARGDLGVEIGDARLPIEQKRLISKARELNRVAITATQMLESMIDSPIPTRAEVSDVANAVFDGTDAVMLSAETAAGKYPDKAITAMDRVCREVEKQPRTQTSDHRMTSLFGRVDESIAMATMYTANHLRVNAIISMTESGSTPLWMSRISSGIPIFAVSREVETCQRVMLYRGVYPMLMDGEIVNSLDASKAAIQGLYQRGVVGSDDMVILTKGDLRDAAGGTNVMKIIRVSEEDILSIDAAKAK